jgi:DNA-binding NarL/FixJ family response regulator
MTRRIRVLCVEDHPLFREAVARKIELQKDMEVAGVAATGEQAVEMFQQCRPDITVMDLRLPQMSGLDAIRAIRRIDPDAQIIVLTMYEGDQDIYRALEAGAVTYLLKNTLSDDLVSALRAVYQGGRPVPPDVAARLAEHAGLPRLTAREIEIVRLMATGDRNKEIAGALAIAEDTVEAHIRNIFSKLKVHDRTAAVTVALRRGIIHLDS